MHPTLDLNQASAALSKSPPQASVYSSMKWGRTTTIWVIRGQTSMCTKTTTTTIKTSKRGTPGCQKGML